MRQPRPARAQHHGGHHPQSSSETQSLSRTVSTAASTGAPLDSDELPAVKSSPGAGREQAGRASIPGVDPPKGTSGPSASGLSLEEMATGRPQSSRLETRSSGGNGDGSPAQGTQEAPARLQSKGRQEQQAASHEVPAANVPAASLEVPAASVQAGQRLQGAPGQLEQLTHQLAGVAPLEDAKDS